MDVECFVIWISEPTLESWGHVLLCTATGGRKIPRKFLGYSCYLYTGEQICILITCTLGNIPCNCLLGGNRQVHVFILLGNRQVLFLYTWEQTGPLITWTLGIILPVSWGTDMYTLPEHLEQTGSLVTRSLGNIFHYFYAENRQVLLLIHWGTDR